MAYYDGDDNDDEDLELMDTESPRDRQPGLLTYDDREYLFGEKDVEGAAEDQLRQRLRDRVRNGLLDFELLLARLEDRDIATIFEDVTPPPWPEGGDDGEGFRSVEYALAFLYHGVSEYSRVDFEAALEDAIREGGTRSSKARGDGYFLTAEPTVNIDVDWTVAQADLEAALESLREGEPLRGEEIAALVRHGDLSERDWELLRERGSQY